MIAQFDLFLELFPHCNLNCDFCHQRRCDGYRENYSSYVMRPKSTLIKECKQSIIANNLKSEHVAIIGGELFYDNNACYVQAFDDLLDTLNPRSLNVTSNLVFDLDHSVLFKHCLDRPNFSVSTSYNPLGRYKNQAMLSLFESNVKKLTRLTMNGGPMLSIEVVLQPDVLTMKTELPFLDYIRDLNEQQPLVDCVFLVDYRGYSEQILDNFNSLLLVFVERYPVFENVKYLFDKRNTKSNLCACTQDGTYCLSYNNGFKVKPYQACIDQDQDFAAVRQQLIENYGCSTCEYYDLCKDVCLAGLKRSGLLRKGQPCYQRFLYKICERK